jgi:uncharacterized ferritin-like protein (DUF455 family)
MTLITDNPSDESLFEANPARDSRFTVKDRWVDCANFPSGNPFAVVEFLHRQMNEEVDSLESSARTLADFPNVDWEIRMWLARQCSDESRHAAMYRRIFEKRGGMVGQYPVLNFQYRIITKCNTLVGRLAIQNRSFEAGGLDAIRSGIETSLQDGDNELAELYESQLADEIVHVRFANEWIRSAIQKDPVNVMRIGSALTLASKAFQKVMGREGVEGAARPVASTERMEAGFTDEEIRFTANLMASKD